MVKKTLIMLIICMLVLSTSLLTFATSESDLKNQQSQIENKIDAAEDELKGVKSELTETLKEIQKLDSSIEESEEELATITSAISSLKKEIKELQTQLEETQKKYDEQKRLLQERIIAQYEAGDVTYLDVLLNSASLTDFISNYYLVSELAEMDQEILDDIDDKKKDIEASKTKLETKQADYKTKQAEAEKVNVSLKNKKTQKDNYYSKLTDEEKSLQKKIDQYKKDAADIAEEIRRYQESSAGSTPTFSGGKLRQPITSYKYITTYFREPDPWGIPHRGMDFAAPAGTNILAAGDGVVVKAQWNNSYGNYVTIYHGGSLYTVYAHARKLNVKTGQKVKAGDVIAYVGSTGNSTGNHLHFEVQEGGALKNPLNYIK